VQAHTGRQRLFEEGFTSDSNSGRLPHGSKTEHSGANREASCPNTSTKDPRTPAASPLPTPCPSPPRPASRGGRRRNTAAQNRGSSAAEQVHPRPPWPAHEVDRPGSASLRRRSSLQRTEAAGSLPIPPSRRHREGSLRPRPRSPNPPLPSLLTKLRLDPALDAALHGRRRGRGPHRWPAERRTHQGKHLIYGLYRGDGRPSPGHSGRQGRRRRGRGALPDQQGLSGGRRGGREGKGEKTGV
jgi:hypothetical protein